MSRHSKREEEERDILGELGGWLVYILLIIGLTYLIITFVGQRTMVSGSSMETTLQDGDNLIVDKISYRFRDPKRYDIIVFPYKYEEDTYFMNAADYAKASDIDGIHMVQEEHKKLANAFADKIKEILS